MELHAFLRDADRAAKSEFVQSARERLESIANAAATFLRAAEAMAHSANDALTARVANVRAAISLSPDEESLRAELDGLVTKLRAGYEELAATLRAAQVDVPQLRPANYLRNVFHVFFSLFSATLIFTLRDHPWILIGIAVAFALSGWAMEITRRTSPAVNERLMGLFKHVSHPHEAHQINSSTWYATALLGLALTMQPVIMIVGVLVLGFADPAAAIIGRRLGRVKLVNGRTLEGTSAFVVVGGLATFGILASLGSYLNPALTTGNWAAISFCGALVGGIAELFSRRIDDNMSVPWAGALGAWLAMTLFVA